MRFLILSFILGVAMLCGDLMSCRGAVASEGCVTARCHASLLQGKQMHPVAQSCDNCHQAVMAPHPQKNKKTFSLVQEVPQLCAMCHQPFGTKKTVHNPVGNGMCLSCHSPHSSDESRLLLQPVQTLCLTCHADKTAQAHVHGPAATGDCTSCHSPHESENRALVLKDGPELCFLCHVDMQGELQKKNVHPAVLGGCTSCHNPHSSPSKKMLSAEGDALCFQCHPQIGERIGKAKSVHRPIKSEKSCSSCHSPHASNGERLMEKTGKELCLSCHKDFIKKNQTVLHGPLKDGKCTPCHDPHGSPHSKLLIQGYSSDLYVPYTDKEYQLCFTCHNRDLLRFPDTSFATGFRDGDRNLHYVHVNKKEKGRNCKVCHSLHGSEFPKLISDKVPFGKWELPLRFQKTETGGSCAPGCHKKYNYDRETPGKGPEAVKAKEKEKTK